MHCTYEELSRTFTVTQSVLQWPLRHPFIHGYISKDGCCHRKHCQPHWGPFRVQLVCRRTNLLEPEFKPPTICYQWMYRFFTTISKTESSYSKACFYSVYLPLSALPKGNTSWHLVQKWMKRGDVSVSMVMQAAYQTTMMKRQGSFFSLPACVSSCHYLGHPT